MPFHCWFKELSSYQFLLPVYVYCLLTSCQGHEVSLVRADCTILIIMRSRLTSWALVRLLTSPECGKTPHTLWIFSLLQSNEESFLGQAFTKELLNILRFLSFSCVTVTFPEKGRGWMSASFTADLILSVGVNTAQCSLPQPMESHSAGPLGPANWGSFLSQFILQCVIIPTLLWAKGNSRPRLRFRVWTIWEWCGLLRTLLMWLNTWLQGYTLDPMRGFLFVPVQK